MSDERYSLTVPDNYNQRRREYRHEQMIRIYAETYGLSDKIEQARAVASGRMPISNASVYEPEEIFRFEELVRLFERAEQLGFHALLDAPPEKLVSPVLTEYQNEISKLQDRVAFLLREKERNLELIDHWRAKASQNELSRRDAEHSVKRLSQTLIGIILAALIAVIFIPLDQSNKHTQELLEIKETHEQELLEARMGVNANLESYHQEGYDQGYADGHEAGLRDSYSLSTDDSYDDGYAAGYADGAYENYIDPQEHYSDGYADGYNDGYYDGSSVSDDSSYEDGYDDGYYYGLEVGYNDGYYEGYADGYADNEPASSYSGGNTYSGSSTGGYDDTYSEPPVSSTVYITESGTKYHRAGCQYLSKSCISISKSSAQSRGYTACSRCKP